MPLFIGPGSLLWVSIAPFILFVIGYIARSIIEQTLTIMLYGPVIIYSFMVLYFLNFGVVLGCLASTLADEALDVMRPLSQNMYEDVRALLPKYQALKEYFLLLVIMYKFSVLETDFYI